MLGRASVYEFTELWEASMVIIPTVQMKKQSLEMENGEMEWTE